MASSQQVREYLAHWFQLGKPMVLDHEGSECLPEPIFQQGHYSPAFEDCWQRILSACGQGCYIKGTSVTVAMMLTPAWDMTTCPRCPMPVLMPAAGIRHEPCPCHDIPTWPNDTTPPPRLGVDNNCHLNALRERLKSVQGRGLRGPRQALDPADTASSFSAWRGRCKAKKS